MRYSVKTSGFPMVTISKIPAGEKIYAERNCCIASSPVTSSREDLKSGSLLRRRLMVTELEGQNYIPAQRPTAISRAWEEFKLGTRQTLDRKRVGERSYVLYEALADEQKVTFRSCFPGSIMIWNTKPLEPHEQYQKDESAIVDFVDDSTQDEVVHFLNEENHPRRRPHGVLYAVKGSFLAAQLSVKTTIFHTEDIGVKRFSETDDSFQKYSGDGNVFLEVHGDLIEIPLYEDEAVDIWPGHLLAFTEGVKPAMMPAGDVTLRNEENNDYVIRLKATKGNGFVYAHSVRRTDFWAGMPRKE